MKHQLHWNEETQSGYVRNRIYPKGYVFEGLELKPVLPHPYQSLIYDEVSNTYLVTINDEEIEMAQNVKIDSLNACSSWVDETYIKDNNVLDVAKDIKITVFKDRFDMLVEGISPNTPSHEMMSWSIQEKEARGNTPTPFLDALHTSRAFNETKGELRTKIIEKANAYQLLYADILGDYHRVLSKIEQASTIDEVNLVVWGE